MNFYNSAFCQILETKSGPSSKGFRELLSKGLYGPDPVFRVDQDWSGADV